MSICTCPPCAHGGWCSPHRAEGEVLFQKYIWLFILCFYYAILVWSLVGRTRAVHTARAPHTSGVDTSLFFLANAVAEVVPFDETTPTVRAFYTQGLEKV